MQEQINQQQTDPKKSKWWLWLIIALVVLGIGAYVLFSGSDGGIIGGGIPQPPALPN